MTELDPKGLKAAKSLATSFFYWWHNQPGTNTEQGFDAWADGDGKERIRSALSHPPQESVPVSDETELNNTAKIIWDSFHGYMGGEWPGLGSDLMAADHCKNVAQLIIDTRTQAVLAKGDT